MELKDELEVPGHVVMHESMVVVRARVNKIMDEWEKQGFSKPNDVPECKKKEEFWLLLELLGVRCERKAAKH